MVDEHSLPNLFLLPTRPCVSTVSFRFCPVRALSLCQVVTLTCATEATAATTQVADTIPTFFSLFIRSPDLFCAPTSAIVSCNFLRGSTRGGGKWAALRKYTRCLSF